jgi:hypothetical protein
LINLDRAAVWSVELLIECEQRRAGDWGLAAEYHILSSGVLYIFATSYRDLLKSNALRKTFFGGVTLTH